MIADGDDRLWAEALNLGAYEVLVQPFDPEEVTRVVFSAWRNWELRLRTAAPEIRAAAAGLA
jgi:hypothetical protein